MLTGAYSDKYKLVQQDQVQQLRTNSARRREQDRAKTLRQETLRRRKALEDKKKHDAEKEAKRREQELAKRRERQQEATEKFQRAHVRQGSARGRKSRTPTLDEVLRQVRGTSSGASTTAGITNTSARTVFSRKYGGSNPDLANETAASRGLLYGKLTAEMRTTSERNLASSKKMFEQQLEEQNRLLAEQQQRTIKELHEEVEQLRRSSSLSSLDSLDENRSHAVHHPSYRTDQAISGITVDSKYTDPNYVSQGLYAQGVSAARAAYDRPYGQHYSSALVTDPTQRGQAAYQYHTEQDTNFQANGYSHQSTAQQPAIIGRPKDVGNNIMMQHNVCSSATSVPVNSGYPGVKSFLGVSGVRIQQAAVPSVTAAQKRLFTVAPGDQGEPTPSGGGNPSHAYPESGNELQIEEANESVQDSLVNKPHVIGGVSHGTDTSTVSQAPYSNPRYRLLFSQKKAWSTPTSQAEETIATTNGLTLNTGAGLTSGPHTMAPMVPSSTMTVVSQTSATSVSQTSTTTSALSVSQTSDTTTTSSMYSSSRPALNYTRVADSTVPSFRAHNHMSGYTRTDHDRHHPMERYTSYVPGSQGGTATGAGISVKGHAVSSEQHSFSIVGDRPQLHDTQKRLELLRQERDACHPEGLLEQEAEEGKGTDNQSDIEEFEVESESEPPKPKIIKGILKKKSKYDSHPSRPFSVVITGGRQIHDSVDLAKQEKKKRGIRWVDLTYDEDDKEKDKESVQATAPQVHVGARPQPITQVSRPTTTPQATAIQNGPTRLQTGRRRVSSAGTVRKAILARAKAASKQGTITIHANGTGSPETGNGDAVTGNTTDQGRKQYDRQLGISTCSYSVQGSPSHPQSSTQMPRKVENTKQSNTQLTENGNDIYGTSGLRLDKTPTDDEINWLWDKVRSCLNQRPDRAGMETTDTNLTATTPKQDVGVSGSSSGSRQTAQMAQLTLDGGRLAGTDVVPKVRTMPRVGGFTSTAPVGGRRRTVSDSTNASMRRSALLQQRNQQRANTLQKAPVPAAQQVRVTEISKTPPGPLPSSHEPGSRTSGPTDSEVTESLAAFLEAEYMSDQPISEAEIVAALDAMHNRQTGQKAHSALSMEEQRLLQSLDRLNQRLKVTETVTQNAATNMTQKPPLHPGTRNAQSKPKRAMSATTVGPRYHFRTGSADTNPRAKKNNVYQ